MAVPRVAFGGQSIPAYAKTVGRAVHVRIYPRPQNLDESRQVLRVLQQYGEVISYRHLKHDYRPANNIALAIFQNPSSAQNIINASPLRFETGRVESSSSVSQFMPPIPPSANEEEEDSDAAPQDTIEYAHEEFDEVNTTRQRPNEAPGRGTAFTGLGGTARWGEIRSSVSTEQAATSPSPSESSKILRPKPPPLKASAADLPKPPQGTQQIPPPPYSPREFHLTIERSHLNHHAYIQRQHYYAGFELGLKGLMGDDLGTRVPVAGMADCRLGKPEVSLRVRMKRQQDENKEGVMSLRSLWEEGEREREAARERTRNREHRREKIWEKRMERWKEEKKPMVRKTTWSVPF